MPQLEILEDRAVPSFVFQTIDDPNAGTGTNGVQGTFAVGINASGLISGNYGDANNVTHGFLLSHGQYTTFDDPVAGTAPFQGTNAFSLNDQGQVVGFYWDTTPNPITGFNEHGFLLSHGQYTTLDEPNAVGVTQAAAINDSGQIVGYYLDASSVYHGFLLSHGQYTTLDDPNAGTGPLQGTLPEGIKASGQIVGPYVDANNVVHGFLLAHGQYTTLDAPNAGTAAGQGTAVRQNNASGQITGTYADANNVFHGFLLSHGQYTTFDDPNAGTGAFLGTLPNGIGASGNIVGDYVDANSVTHGFLATPAHGDAPVGAAGSPASGSALDSAGGTTNMLVAAAARWNATPTDTPVVSTANSSGFNRGDALGRMSKGQTTAIVTVPSMLRGSSDSPSGRVYVVSAAAAAARHASATVDAVFASIDDLFGHLTPI